MNLKKLKTKEEIRGISEDLRKKGKIIVTANGSFDILHAGHVRFLKEAKEQGDVLIIGLNSDKSVKTNKGNERPIIPEAFRAELLDAIEYIDHIVILDEPEIGVPLIKLVKPDVHCNGAEYGKDCAESFFLKKPGARLHLIDKTKYGEEEISTSTIIEKIKKQQKEKKFKLKTL